MPNATVVYAPRVPGVYEAACWTRHGRDLALAYPDGVVPDRVPGGDPQQARREGTRHPKGYWYNPDAAEHPITFIERHCKHHKGEWAGRPLLLEEWQKRIIRIVFGWLRADGTRRFRIAYIELPRKNGKSELAAALGLYLLAADQEPGAEVFCSATKKDQAKIVHDTATAMVQASSDLQRRIVIQRNSLTVPRLMAKMEPLGADSDTLDGLNPHGNIVDELHAHKDRHVWDVMDTAMGARRQPLTLAITTAGLYNPESIGYEQHTHAMNVLDGAVEDDAFFAFIACASETDDPFAEATWRTANPNYGVSVKPDHMAEQAAKAHSRPSFLNAFLRLHLDRWTQQQERWLDIATWIASDESLTPEAYAAREAALVGQVCYAGVDLSARIALTALVLVFPLPNDAIELVCRFWIPEARLTDPTAKRDRVPYDAWVRDGWLRTTPGDVVQHSFVRAELSALAARYNIREVALDPWNATELSNQLQDDGFETDPRADGRVLIEVPQQMKHLSEACKRFEELIVGGRVRHGGHPVLRHHVASVAKREDANGNIAPDKKASTDRIDGVVATINGLSRLIVQPTPTDSPWLLFQIGATPNAEESDAVRT